MASVVVVAGGGMAGLAAAVRAAEEGARVTLLEKGAELGGSVAISNGIIWTAASLDGLRAVAPEGEPELGERLVDSFKPAVEWLRGLGVGLGPWMESVFDFGVGCRLIPDARAAYVEPMARALRTARVRILLRAAASGVERDDRGAVAAVRVTVPKGPRRISTRALVLAGGGFQANPELTTRYIGRWADRLWLRSNPRSTGDGLLIGLAAGAATSRGLHAFYGHLQPAPPARVDASNFAAVTPYWSDRCVLLNLRGERFTDESDGDPLSAQALAREPLARGVLVFNRHVYEESLQMRLPGMSPIDTLAAWRSAGAMIAEAESLKRLVNEIARWGVPGAQALATLQEFEQAAIEGRMDELPVPRRAQRRTLNNPPLYAVLVTPGITFTNGGLRIDGEARVLDRRGEPIPGLYAAGADAGGILYEGYAGGLAPALVFGRIAGESAAVYARRRSGRSGSKPKARRVS